MNILLVEDNRENQLLMKFCLDRTPHKLDLAENGQEAVHKFEQGNYNLVLMDIQMPVMDGLEATRRIRQWEKDNHLDIIPIIALTANATNEDKKNCLQSGCSDLITKPIKIPELLNTLLEISEKVRPEGRNL